MGAPVITEVPAEAAAAPVLPAATEAAAAVPETTQSFEVPAGYTLIPVVKDASLATQMTVVGATDMTAQTPATQAVETGMPVTVAGVPAQPSLLLAQRLAQLHEE